MGDVQGKISSFGVVKFHFSNFTTQKLGPLRKYCIDASAVGKAIAATPSSPDAIVCGNDEQAILLTETLARLGKRIPDDVAVVGFDDIAAARLATPPLTTISQPVRKLAATAFKTLLARMRYPNNDPREILLDAPLIVRLSTSELMP